MKVDEDICEIEYDVILLRENNSELTDLTEDTTNFNSIFTSEKDLNIVSQLKISTSFASKCIDNIIQHNDIQEARERIKENQKNSQYIIKILIESKRLTSV